MFTYRRWRTHTACGMRTPPTVRVHLSTLIHDSDAHRQFLRYAYAIFRPSGCVGTPRGLKQAVGDGLLRIADFGYLPKPRAACQSASQCDCRLSNCASEQVLAKCANSILAQIELFSMLHYKILNHRYSELRGAENPNQARYHCPFAIPIRRSSMPGHRGFRMERLGRNIMSSIFSEMTVKI